MPYVHISNVYVRNLHAVRMRSQFRRLQYFVNVIIFVRMKIPSRQTINKTENTTEKIDKIYFSRVKTFFHELIALSPADSLSNAQLINLKLHVFTLLNEIFVSENPPAGLCERRTHVPTGTQRKSDVVPKSVRRRLDVLYGHHFSQ